MKTTELIITGTLILALVGSSLEAQEEIREELEARKNEIDGKIDDLFGHRDFPIPPLPANFNPFYRTEALPPPEESAEEQPFVPPTRQDADLLAAIADNLAINGIVTFNNRDLVVINQSPTPEGRVVSVDFEDKTHFVRVEEIHSNRVVLSMGNAFMAIPIDRSDRNDEPAAPSDPVPAGLEP